MIYTIGLDPGITTGWAFAATDLHGEVRIMAHGQTGRPKVPTTGVDVAAVFEQIRRVCPGASPPVIVGERPFIPGKADRDGKERAQALGAMDAQAALYRWIGVAEVLKCTVFRHRDGRVGVPPGVWRSDQWGAAMWTTQRAKKTAVRRAEALWGLRIPLEQHHSAEACFLAAYGGLKIREQRQKGRKKGRSK